LLLKLSTEIEPIPEACGNLKSITLVPSILKAPFLYVPTHMIFFLSTAKDIGSAEPKISCGILNTIQFSPSNFKTVFSLPVANHL